MAYNIVLVEPEIHTNTGNIGRLSLASGSNLHLVKPFGFEITDTRLKRAGLDYWQYLDVKIYENIEEFYAKNVDKKMVYLSSKSDKIYTEIPFEDDLFLIFGKESVGLSEEITDLNKEDVYTIPMFSEHIRSLNLANSVSIVVYEGIRRLQ
ncbi:tRNA (cytidine(34)-2'-O)-methyltransferase [Kordia sp.]|uniref:tRNA (cytidine(34)-2'-O)-methyltransferase n=1 Tax=Kordia sp. TaxID=1965332 RepID=UPI0025BDFC77|nr:tRNA (cytidine(34)-2'-O)-methyltransferase [Kordia sp.]MCH2195923.1 tRNA (cytidine(34)-2'-O)-methyltransferase [Kordia sp.]